MEQSTLQFVPFKSDSMDPEEASRRARAIIAGVIDEELVQKEAHEMLAKISFKNCKRKRTLPPVSSSQDTDSPENMVTCLKSILKKSYQDKKSPGLGKKALECPTQFALILDSCDVNSFDIHEFFSFIKYNPLTDIIMKNICILLQHKWIILKDIAEELDEENFNKVCFHLVCDDSYSSQVIEFLANRSKYRSTVTQICVSSVLKPPGISLSLLHLSLVTMNDLLSSLLRRKDTVTLEETYSKVVDIFKEELLQQQACKIQEFIPDLSLAKTFTVLTTTCHVCDVSPRFLIVIWIIIIKMESEDSVNKFDFLSDFLKDAISKRNHHNFTLAIILMRLLDMVGNRAYSESYQLFFGNTSTIITSSKSVEFIMDEFTNLVPYEVGMFLKQHIQLPLRGGAKFKDKLDQFLILAKTRMKDFSLVEIDKNVVHDVEKAIVTFKKKRSVPSSIIEASIFKKQYYVNHFLPCLMKKNCVDDEEGRHELVNALKSANKIPKSVLNKPEPEVVEITPAENLEDLISSLPTRGYEIKDAVYSLCCSGCDRETMTLLIQTVCSRCSNIEPVVFLKDFAVTHHLSDMFKDCVLQLCHGGAGCSSVFDLLELFDSSTCSGILKSVLVLNKPLYKLIPVSLEMEYLHIIVLGKLDENIEAPIPDAVWKQLSIERLCETVTWWSHDPHKLAHFQVLVSTIFDNVISNQACNDVCTILFKSSLSLNILPLISSTFITLLPLTSFSKLWVYEALAQVLLPLYQTSSEKPVSKIKEIFRNFFNVINVVKPSLLYRCGGVRSVDNLLSVLDSYKIYITTDKFILSYAVTLTIIRSVQDEVSLNVLLEKSPTFLISCVCYTDELTKIRGAEYFKSNDHVNAIVSFLKKLEKEGVSSNDYPNERYRPHIGVCWFLLYADKHLSDFSAVAFQNTIMEGYVTAIFYSYSNLWLSGTLTSRHVTNLGELAVKCCQYHGTYTVPLLERVGPGNGVLDLHFNGYKSNKVFCLLYLGGIAHCYERRYQLPDTILPLAKKSYSQAQRLVYDNTQTMGSMQKFMMSITRGTQDTSNTANTFISCLTRGFSFRGA